MWVLPMRAREGVVAWEGLLALPQVLAFIYAYEWVLRVRGTIATNNLNTKGPDRLLRIAQDWPWPMGLAAIALPEWRAAHFSNLVLDPGEKVHPSFWIFFIPMGLSMLLGTAGTLFTLNRRPDRAEIAPAGGICDRRAHHGRRRGAARPYRAIDDRRSACWCCWSVRCNTT